MHSCKLLTIPKYQILFSKARLNMLPLGKLLGRCAGILFFKRLCKCNSGKLDTIWHSLIECNKYSVDPHLTFSGNVFVYGI